MDFLAPIGPGTRIGPYTLVRELGEGSMGVVYEARHRDPAMPPRALKVLAPWLVSELGRRRFAQEIETCSRLSHPNTVEILDYGESSDGVLYYAMELLDGCNLDELIGHDGAQPTGRALRILQQIAGALGEAHDHGLIHRDIKPSNIILCRVGDKLDIAKLVDFGLVMPMWLSPTRRLTLDGYVMGTPRYVAPEMIKGDDLSVTVDFYALGLVAFYLLTATHAFDSSEPMEILRQQRDDPPPLLSERLPGVDREVDRIVSACLAKDPAARPASAKELASALQACETRSPWNEDDARRWWSEKEARKDAKLNPPPTLGSS